MAERKIVGWFYRNGKRIPIFEKVTATQRRELSSAEYKTAMRNSDNPNLTSAAVMGMHPDVDDKIMMSKDGIYRSGKYEDYNRAKDLGWEYEGTVSDAARKAGVFDDKPRNKGIRRDPDPKTLRENIKLKGKSERASKVKDASFTTRAERDLERDIMENPGDYGILHHEPRKSSNIKRGEGKLRAHYQDDKAGAYYKDYNSTKDMKADIAKETKKKSTDLITTRKAKVRSARRKTPIEATTKKPVATGKGSLRTNNSEIRRRMWGTPGVPGKEKPTLDIRGKRRSSYDIPQRRAFAGKPIEESYIKYVMKEYGFSRADAVRLIKDKREGK